MKKVPLLQCARDFGGVKLHLIYLGLGNVVAVHHGLKNIDELISDVASSFSKLSAARDVAATDIEAADVEAKEELMDAPANVGSIEIHSCSPSGHKSHQH